MRHTRKSSKGISLCVKIISPCVASTTAKHGNVSSMNHSTTASPQPIRDNSFGILILNPPPGVNMNHVYYTGNTLAAMPGSELCLLHARTCILRRDRLDH